MIASREDIKNSYRMILEREPTSAEINAWLVEVK